MGVCWDRGFDLVLDEGLTKERMYLKNKLFNLKDVHCSSIFFAHRAENLSEASPFVVLSSQGLHCAVENEHPFMVFSFYLFFVPEKQIQNLETKSI